MITKTILHERVQKGAKWLDEIRPGWASEIKLDELDMGFCTECVLGQLYGHFREAVPVDGDPEDRRLLHETEAVALGFLTDIGEYYFNDGESDGLERTYGQLTHFWKEVIKTRL